MTSDSVVTSDDSGRSSVVGSTAVIGGDDGEHVDDERERVAALDDLTTWLLAVGQIVGDVQLHACWPWGGADEALVPNRR